MNIAAKIQIRSIFTLASNSTRVSNLCGRKADKIYGVEEGHGHKNEVRGEKWIKRYRAHKNGEDWRLANGYDKKQHLWMLETGHTWTDVDSGLPGSPTDHQKIRQLKNLQLAQDIFEAAMLVQRAKDMK